MINTDTPLSQIKMVLSDKHREGRDADLELAKRVVNNNIPSVNYYTGEFSDSIVQYIKRKIYEGDDPRSDMFFVLSSPVRDDGSFSWHRVSLYQAYKGCSLHTYTENICVREMVKFAKRKKKISNKERAFLDYLDYRSLVAIGATNNDDDDDEDEKLLKAAKVKRVKEAFLLLNEKNQRVIQLLVIEKHRALDVYDQLEMFIHPKPKNGLTSEEVKQSWSDKQKQDALSLLKNRAIFKLNALYLKI